MNLGETKVYYLNATPRKHFLCKCYSNHFYVKLFTFSRELTVSLKFIQIH